MLAFGVIYGTSERHVLRNAVIALAIADVGHVYATYAAMGLEPFLDVASWTAVAWGNIGFTGFLFVNRVAYLLGVFGSGAVPGETQAKSKAKKRN